MLKKCLILILSSLLVLTACNSPVYNQTEGNVADVKLKAAEARAKSDASAKPKPALSVNQGLYVDTTPISLEHDPSWLHNNIVIRGDQLPFSYYSRVIASGAGKNILTKYQVGLDPSANVSLSYSGSIKGALDLLASKSGFVYSVHNNRIYWQAFVTRTFDVAFMPGSSDYLMGKASGGGSSQQNTNAGTQTSSFVNSDATEAEYSNLSGKLSIWADLELTVKQLLTPDGKVTVSQATTTMTVRDRPTNVELVAQYVGNLNRNLSKQVLVKIQILEVDLQNDYNLGIDWAVVTKAFHNSKFVINGNYGTPVSLTALTPQAAANQVMPQMGSEIINTGIIPGYTILFNALSQQGKTSIVSEPRVVCLNNQVSVVRIVESSGYVASVQNTSVGGSSTQTAQQNTVTSQVTPGTLVTGLTLYILPKIMNSNVYMQVNADLSTNKGFTTFPGSNSIQLPNVTEKHFNQRSMIKSGDTLILSGFRQLVNKANANQFLDSQALGGKGSAQANKETIVLITPFILNGSV